MTCRTRVSTRSVPEPVNDFFGWAYGSYWNRVIGQWGERRLDEIAPSEIGS